MTSRRIITLGLLAIIGIAATSSAIHEAISFTRYQNTDLLGDRVRRVLSDPAVDTLFVGTSRTDNMIDPDRFDAAMKSGGHPTHSYVAGMPAMSIPEIESLLRAVLNAKLCCLRTVFIEPDFAFMTPAMMQATARSIHFSSFGNTLSMLTYIDSVDQSSLRDKKSELRANMIYWASLRLFNIGLARYLLDDRFTDYSAAETQRGYVSFPFLHAPGFADDPEAVKTFRAQVGEIADSYRGKRSFSQVLSKSQWTYFANVVQTVKERGIQVTLLHAPQYAYWIHGVAWAQSYSSRCITGVPLFDLSNPDEYPQFFDLANRLDGDHLNSLGVPLYTEELARKFLVYLAQGQDSACTSTHPTK